MAWPKEVEAEAIFGPHPENQLHGVVRRPGWVCTVPAGEISSAWVGYRAALQSYTPRGRFAPKATFVGFGSVASFSSLYIL